MKKNQKKAFILIFALFAAFFAAHSETQGDDIFENQKIEDGDFYKIEREPSKKEIEDENSKFFESVKQKKLEILRKIEKERQKLESSKTKLSSATEKSRLELEKNKAKMKSQLSKKTDQTTKPRQNLENQKSPEKTETDSLKKNAPTTAATADNKQEENKPAADKAEPTKPKAEAKSAPKTPQKPQYQPENLTVAEAEQKMDAAINLRKKFIDLGMGYKGIEYVWGGKTPRPGFDCSGLVSYTAKQSLGIEIKGNAQDIYNHTSPVSLGDALPGDLIFFKGPADTRITHVGIYLGKNPGENDFGKQNLFLNAASAGPRTGVIISGLNENYWKKTFYGCGRIIPEI